MRQNDTTDKCGFPTKGHGLCGLPAGFGVQGSLGEGHCYHHRGAEVASGVPGTAVQVVAERALGDIKKLGGRFRYQMSRDTRLGEIMSEMGATLDVADASEGLVQVDLTFEICAARAMLILFMERHAEREDALLAWHQLHLTGDLSSPPPRILSIVDGHKAVAGVGVIAKTM